jgi:hypothetical protein
MTEQAGRQVGRKSLPIGLSDKAVDGGRHEARSLIPACSSSWDWRAIIKRTKMLRIAKFMRDQDSIHE